MANKTSRVLDNMTPLRPAHAPTHDVLQAKEPADPVTKPSPAQPSATQTQATGLDRQQCAPAGPMGQGLRLFAFAMIGLAVAYLINNYLIFWQGFDPVLIATSQTNGKLPLWGGGALALTVYALALLAAVGWGLYMRVRSLRRTSARLSDLATVLIRCAFFSVLAVGLGDFVISLLDVEGLAEPLLGADAAALFKSKDFRAYWVHLPLVLGGVIAGILNRGLGFIWLCLMIVFAELLIVLFDNVYSTQSTYTADLVRFWHGALFLFAAAYTLKEGGHVRVDVLFASLSTRAKARVNLWGTLILGFPFAWVILIVGTWSASHFINLPIQSLEFVESTGLYTQYISAAFLLALAGSLIVQFSALLLSAAADLSMKEAQA